MESPELKNLKRRYAAGEYVSTDEVYSLIQHVESLERSAAAATLQARVHQVFTVLRQPTPSVAQVLHKLKNAPRTLQELKREVGDMRLEIRSWERMNVDRERRERSLQDRAFRRGYNFATGQDFAGQSPYVEDQ